MTEIRAEVSQEGQIPGGLRYKLAIRWSIPIPIVAITFLLWPRHVVGGLYACLDFLQTQPLTVGLVGSTVLFGCGLISTRPRIPRFFEVLIIFGIILGVLLIALGFFSRWINPPRWLGPSLAILQSDDALHLLAPINEMATEIGEKTDNNIELSTPKIRSDRVSLQEAILAARRNQFDVVVLDIDYPLRFTNIKNPKALLNPRTLYVVTRPVAPDSIDDLPNVVFLLPPLVDEVFAIATHIPKNATRIRIVHSSEVRAERAAKLLEYTIKDRGYPPPEIENLDDPGDINVGEGELVVWLGWLRETLPDDFVGRADRPTILQREKGGPTIIQPATMPFVGLRRQDLPEGDANQIEALHTILVAHFVKKNRPLNVRESVEEAARDLAQRHLASLSREMRLMPRYRGLGVEP